MIKIEFSIATSNMNLSSTPTLISPTTDEFSVSHQIVLALASIPCTPDLAIEVAFVYESQILSEWKQTANI